MRWKEWPHSVDNVGVPSDVTQPLALFPVLLELFSPEGES